MVKRAIIAVAAAAIAATQAIAGPGMPGVIPEKISTKCGRTYQVYDHCRDQSAILAEAEALAAKTGRSVLAVFGHDVSTESIVLLAYLTGQRGPNPLKSFDGLEAAVKAGRPEELEKAKALAAYVRENFVVVALAVVAPESTRWRELTESLGLLIGANGFFLAGTLVRRELVATLPNLRQRPDMAFPHRVMEPLNTKIGYDREKLLEELKALRAITLVAERRGT